MELVKETEHKQLLFCVISILLLIFSFMASGCNTDKDNKKKTEIEAKNKTVVELVIEKLPDKTTFVENSSGVWIEDEEGKEYYHYTYFDFTGMEMKIIYDDGSEDMYVYDEWLENFYKDFFLEFETYQKENHWELGEQKIEITYRGCRVDIPVEVVESKVDKIEIVKLPDKTKYIEKADGDKNVSGFYVEDQEYQYIYEIDPKGMEIEIKYSDGSSEIYTFDNSLKYDFKGELFEINYDGFGRQIGELKCEVSYQGKRDEFSVSIIDNPVEKIEIVSEPYKKEFFEGYPFSNYLQNLDGLKIKIIYKSGEVKEWEWNGTDSCYFDGYPIDIDYNAAPFELMKDANTMQVVYMGCYDNYSIKVKETDVQSLEVVKPPNRTEYSLDYEIFANFEGASIKINYKDGTSEICEVNLLSNESTWELSRCYLDNYPASMALDTVNNEMELTYKNVSLKYPITITDSREITSIEITKEPDLLSGKGMELKVHYYNGASEIFKVLETDTTFVQEKEGYTRYGSCFYTDEGIYSDWIEIERYYNNDKTYLYKVQFLGRKASLQSVPKADAAGM